MHRLSDTGGSDAMPIDHNVPRSIRKRASHIFQRLPRSTFSQMRRQLNRARSMSQMSMPRFRANRRKQRPKSRPPLVPEESEDLQETNPLLPGIFFQNGTVSFSSRTQNFVSIILSEQIIKCFCSDNVIYIV